MRGARLRRKRTPSGSCRVPVVVPWDLRRGMIADRRIPGPAPPDRVVDVNSVECGGPQRTELHMLGLYDLVQEHFTASQSARGRLKAEREHRFPFVEGGRNTQTWMYVEVVGNAWAWSHLMSGCRYVDNNG